MNKRRNMIASWIVLVLLVIWAHIPIIATLDMFIYLWGGTTFIDWTWTRAVIAAAWSILFGILVLKLLMTVYEAAEAIARDEQINGAYARSQAKAEEAAQKKGTV